MKSVFFAAAIALSIVGCGGGGSDPVNSPEIPYASGNQEFTVVTPNFSVKMYGKGDTVQARQKDAAMVVAAGIKPGTTDYQLMMSDKGLTIGVLDEQKSAVAFVAKLTPNGIVISLAG